MDDVVINVEGLWKRYGLPVPKLLRRGGRLLHWRHADELSPDDRDGPWALRGIDLKLRRGDSLGVIGRNGAGKSTLLKVLARVTPATRGRIRVSGTVFPMIQLNAGLHRDLTGVENVFILGAVMGIPRREMKARLPQIRDFCELGPWLEKPVRKYSTGMVARLGFAVAMNVEADVLLVDEVLAVGDTAFQAKCYDRLFRLRGSGATILLVSHSIRQVQRICEKAILLHEGRIQAEGDADEVAAKYYRLSHDHIVAQLMEKANGATPMLHEGTGQLRVSGTTLLDGAGNETHEIGYLEPLVFPRFVIGIHTPDMIHVAVTSSQFAESREKMLKPGPGCVDCTFDRLQIFPGAYSLRVVVGSHHRYYKIDQVENLTHFSIAPNPKYPDMYNDGGFIRLDSRWNLD